MKVARTLLVSLLVLITSCAQIRSLSLPQGITLLGEVDPTGLQSPVWSPDGTMIVASYVIMPMPDSLFGSYRDEIVMIDPETGRVTSFLQTGETIQLLAESWSADSKRFAMYQDSGSGGKGLYTYGVDDPNPAYLSEGGALSSEWKRLALFRGTYIRILDIGTGQEVQKYEVPAEGDWYVKAWSPDMGQLALVYETNQQDRNSSIWLLDTKSGVFSQFSHESDYYNYAPSFSPDGKLIAYEKYGVTEGNQENKLVISRLDGSCVWVIPIDAASDFTWSPDGKRLFMIGSNGVYLADLKTLFGASISSDKGCP